MGEVNARWVDRMHRRRGWSGCGYNAVIPQSGEIQDQRGGYPTRPYGKIAAHVGGCGPGWNKRSIGVSLAGGVKEDGKTPENNFNQDQMEALEQYIRWVVGAFKVQWENVIGHRDLIKMTGSAPKACPCFSVRKWMTGNRFGGSFGTPKDYKRPDKMAVPRTYTVREGDTLWGISQTTGASVEDIMRLSGLEDTTVHSGQKVTLRN